MNLRRMKTYLTGSDLPYLINHLRINKQSFISFSSLHILLIVQVELRGALWVILGPEIVPSFIIPIHPVAIPKVIAHLSLPLLEPLGVVLGWLLGLPI